MKADAYFITYPSELGDEWLRSDNGQPVPCDTSSDTSRPLIKFIVLSGLGIHLFHAGNQ